MIRVENTILPVAALTHPGMKGKNNEDSFGVTAFQADTTPPSQILLALLSDGIGGHRAGEVASALAIDVITQHVAESDGRSPLHILQEAIHLASETIHQQATENTEQQGMGATCACAWIAGNRLYTATVGDSRIYLMRGEQIIQLSIDHTWIQEALERGLIQPDQVNGHPNAHVIRRYLGSPHLPEVDFRMRVYDGESDNQSVTNQGMQLQPNDRLLLCSDGLTDLVEGKEILAAFQEKGMQEAVAFLVNLANERGGHDNITIVVVHLPPTPPRLPVGQPLRMAHPLSRFLVIGCVGAILLGLLVGGVLGGWILTRNGQPTQSGTLTQPAGPLTPKGTPTLTLTPAATLRLTLTASRTPTQTTSAPMQSPTLTETPLTNGAGPGPSLTPWPTNTPSTPLPIVTVNP